MPQLGAWDWTAGNQTARAGELLRGLDLPADVVATSGEWGVAKPSPDFFARVLGLSAGMARETVYVGDHPANDVFPAKAAGLRAAHVRRGPWGYFRGDDPAVVREADWRVRSLGELVSVVLGEKQLS